MLLDCSLAMGRNAGKISRKKTEKTLFRMWSPYICGGRRLLCRKSYVTQYSLTSVWSTSFNYSHFVYTSHHTEKTEAGLEGPCIRIIMCVTVHFITPTSFLSPLPPRSGPRWICFRSAICGKAPCSWNRYRCILEHKRFWRQKYRDLWLNCWITPDSTHD